MNSSLFCGRSDEFIEVSEKNSSKLGLLAKGGDGEVLVLEIKKNEIGILEPGSENQMEFYYVLEGKLSVESYDTKEDNKILQKDDYFYVKKLTGSIMFKTLSEVKLLYFTTQPVFHYLSERIANLVSLAKQVEDKDYYTSGHLDRVKKFALGIGYELALSPEQIEELGFAALLHDLGKVNVPDEILNKPGRLSKDEFEIIKRHSHDGAELVKESYYEYLYTIIDQHHEKIDGTGYPKGLKGDEIILEAKIISVADAYDAMISDRPYRKGLSLEVAKKELIDHSGSQFDSKIVRAFIKYLEENE